MTYPQYRNRYLGAMTPAQMRDLPEKHKIPVILPTGAIEQHGPHLPVGVDSLLCQARLDYALNRLDERWRLLVAPPITFGKSNEHVGFPGTVAISKEVLRDQLWAAARQLHDLGFRLLLILNTHGGNTAVLRYTIQEITDQLPLEIEFLRSPAELDISAQEAAYGFHAGEVETSLMLEILDGEAIAMEHAVCSFPARIEDPGELRPECAPAIFSWVTLDLSPSGIMGDAAAGTPEKGRRWFEAQTQGMLTEIVQYCKRLQSQP